MRSGTPRPRALLLSIVATAACGSGASPDEPPVPSGSPSDAGPVEPRFDVPPWRPPTPAHLVIQQVNRGAGRAVITRIDLATHEIATTVGAAHPVEALIPSTDDGITWIAGDEAGTSPGLIRIGADGPLQRIALPAPSRWRRPTCSC